MISKLISIYELFMNYEYFLFIDLFMISKLISIYELFIDFIDLNFSKSFSKLFSIYELFMKYEYFHLSEI